jgi:hypothetical protein
VRPRNSDDDVSLLLVPLASQIAASQPFGIAEGTPTTQLKVLKELGPYTYLVTPKTAHPDFDAYSVVSTPEDGVCQVAGGGLTLRNDAYGNQARDAFDKITTVRSISEQIQLVPSMTCSELYPS